MTEASPPGRRVGPGVAGLTAAYVTSRAAHVTLYVDDSNQQYLAKHVNGYRCHANTGAKFPKTA